MKIGVDLGGTNIRAGLIDNNFIVTLKSSLLNNQENIDSTLEQIISTIRSVHNAGITGIGIGVPSVVDIDKGIVYDVVNIPSWKEVPLKEILGREFNVPIFINNDVNCFVLGEKYFGFGKNHKSFVGITIGTGIGSGILIDNKLYNGRNGGAGEIGYLPYLDHDFEYYCSSNFFKMEHQTDGYQAYQGAKKNDPRALKLWTEFGHHVGNALKSVFYVYDPEAIILGGSIVKAYPYFQEQMKTTLKDTHFPKSVELLKIYESEIENVTILGAAALVEQYEENTIT